MYWSLPPPFETMVASDIVSLQSFEMILNDGRGIVLQNIEICKFIINK
jgi:hypothetical protein